VRQEPAFLATNGMRVFDGQGRELDPGTLDWSGRGGVNFSLRQDPGPTNALGAIRFDMPNPHAVFIHDTPRQDLFRSDVRFHSSGCARVQDVRSLAEWVLEGSGVDRAEIDHQIAIGETRTLRLARSVPVAWVYLTAWAEGDGTVQFRDDVYGLDTPDGIITSTIVARRAVQAGVSASRGRDTQRVSYLDQR
jgi:murein L,D-transpeptidase YcbB/YkuD